MRNRENRLEKHIFKKFKLCMSICTPLAFYANFPCASQSDSLLQKVFMLSVDLNHDKHLDISGNSAAPYKENVCITYMYFKIFFPEEILQNESIYCP